DPYKNDISVRVSKIPDFLKGLERVIKDKYPHFEVVWFGHIGDGNLHVNILKPDDWSEEKFLAACHETDQEMFKMIQELGGSISAEHGVGLVKKEYLHFSRSKEEICSMKEIKKVFDPDGILNPGKLF
ncbi:MAG: FAD-binding oxidoreductase, partial [Bdellovibrio sp.]